MTIHRENDRSRRLREKAQTEGKLTFNTGLKCKYGHTADRYTGGGGCVQCAVERQHRTFQGKAIPLRPTLNSPCPLCGHPVTGKSHKRTDRKWVRDHDHKTGEFRGWICNICNNGLGAFNDDPILLQKAANYLSKKDL
jgi:hypothetical protein